MPAPRLRNNCRMLGIAERCEKFGDRRCAARHIVSHSTRYGRIGIRRDGRHADTFGMVKYLLGARRDVAREHLDRRCRQRIHIAAYARFGTAHTRILLRSGISVADGCHRPVVVRDQSRWPDTARQSEVYQHNTPIVS